MKKKKKQENNQKNMKEMDEYEKEIKRTLESKLEIIENINSNSMSDLHMEKKIEIKRIRKIEIELEKLKIPNEVIDTIKKLIFTNACCEYYGLYELELESE